MVGITAAGAVVLLAAACASDVRTMTIPNRLTVPAAAAGAAVHALPGAGEGLTFALSGCALGFALLWVLYVTKAVGAGDVKLFAALGAWIGAADVLHTAMYAVLFAGAYGFGWLALNGKRRAEFKTAKFPFMIAVVPGALAAWIF